MPYSMPRIKSILLLACLLCYTSTASIWLSVDPLADKYPGISPYAYCNWNPVKNIDPDGRDVYVFDENGSYIEKRINDGRHFGIVEQNGYLYCAFDFADPIHDPQSIDEGKINHIHMVSDNQISSILTESGVENTQAKHNKYSFILHESNAGNIQGNGLMDYVITGKYEGTDIVNYSNSLFITDVGGRKIAHNAYNFGNFLWGAGASALGVPYLAIWLGSNLNNFFNDPHSRWHFDSKDDQLSIKLGFQWRKQNK